MILKWTKKAPGSDEIKRPDRILIVGGYFDDTPDGFIGEIQYKWSKEDMPVSSKWRTLLNYRDPEEALLVKNKGFAGSSWHKGLLWTCLPNRVLAFNPGNWTVVKSIDDELFNDIHNVHVDDDFILIANTGLESIDEFDHEGTLQKRIFLTDLSKTAKRIADSPCFRTANSKPHRYHLNYVIKNDEGEHIVTLFQQRYVMNYEKLKSLTPTYDAPPHDGSYLPMYFKDVGNDPGEKRTALWTTTIDGRVQCIDRVSNKPNKVWDIPFMGGPKGWARGLLVVEEGFFLGFTVVRDSSAPWFHNWVDQDPEETVTAVSFVNWNGKIHTTFLPENRYPKIFTILPARSGIPE